MCVEYKLRIVRDVIFHFCYFICRVGIKRWYQLYTTISTCSLYKNANVGFISSNGIQRSQIQQFSFLYYHISIIFWTISLGLYLNSMSPNIRFSIPCTFFIDTRLPIGKKKSRDKFTGEFEKSVVLIEKIKISIKIRFIEKCNVDYSDNVSQKK